MTIILDNKLCVFSNFAYKLCDAKCENNSEISILKKLFKSFYRSKKINSFFYSTTEIRRNLFQL